MNASGHTCVSLWVALPAKTVWKMYAYSVPFTTYKLGKSILDAGEHCRGHDIKERVLGCDDVFSNARY